MIEGTAQAGETAEGEIPDDGYYYLFELHPYESGIGSRTDYVSWSNKSEKLSFSIPYSGDPADTRLYSRFVAAVKTGDTYREISGPIYVTNPESVARYTKEYPDSMSKKSEMVVYYSESRTIIFGKAARKCLKISGSEEQHSTISRTST